MATRGFFGRHREPGTEGRLPPGQHLTSDFPVLSAGPTPRVRTESWSFTLKDGPRPIAKWNWDEFNALPRTKFLRDIHCVTTWSKFDTNWGACWSTISLLPPASNPRPRTSSRIHSTAIPPTCPAPTSVTGRPWSR